jgi:hypothetical protein
MSRKRFTPEQIIVNLREAEVLSSRGQRVPAIVIIAVCVVVSFVRVSCLSCMG